MSNLIDTTLPQIYLIPASGERINTLTILETIIKKMSDKEAMDNSKAKHLITDFIEKLAERKDPFTTAIATIGGESGVNAIGVLLFVAFQYGYTLGSKDYKIDLSELNLPGSAPSEI